MLEYSRGPATRAPRRTHPRPCTKLPRCTTRPGALTAVWIRPFGYDDSGCHGGSDVFMWAGYLTNMSCWHNFSQQWYEVLDQDPQLPYWHTSSARHQKERTPFEHVDIGKLRDKEAALARVIAEVGDRMCAIIIRIPMRYVNELIKDKVRFASTLPKRQRRTLGVPILELPVFIGFHYGVIAAIVIAKRLEIPFPLRFIYEARENDPYQAIAAESMTTLRPALGPDRASMVGPLTFLPGKTREGAPLQAADLLAWHMNNRAKRLGRDDPNWEHLCMTRMNVVNIGRRELNQYVAHWNSGEPAVFDFS
jgi:hypothetical protein